MTELSLSVHTDKNDAIFEISDHGCGISEERMKKLFAGFYSDVEENPDTK